LSGLSTAWSNVRGGWPHDFDSGNEFWRPERTIEGTSPLASGLREPDAYPSLLG
jgi:hypothetical protein